MDAEDSSREAALHELRKKNESTLMSAVDYLKTLTDNEERKKATIQLIDLIRKITVEEGGLYYDNINELYRTLKGQKMLVRREYPEKVMELISGEGHIALEFDKKIKDRHPNCAEWSYEMGEKGLDNAFLEGLASVAGVAMVVGINKSPALKIYDIPDDEKFRGGVDRAAVKMAEGDVSPEDLRFLVVRIPAAIYPPEQMTDEEVERVEEQEMAAKPRPQFIFRGFLYPRKAA